jgi:hypothetical protein
MARSKCPKGTICIENYTILFLLVLFAVVVYYTYTRYYCPHCGNVELTATHASKHMHVPIASASESGYQMLRPIASPGVSYNKNPSDTLLNPYAPPVRYNEHHAYKQIGYLKNEQYGNKLFPIFAKPVHLRRDKWYYYTIFDNIKLPIYSNGRKCSSEHGCDSLMSGDAVQLENMNDSFQVSMYDNHTLTYDPVI